MRKRVRFLLPCLLVGVLVGCQGQEDNIPKYSVGEIIRSKLTGQKGQIIARSRFCGNVCLYDVRFAGLEIVTKTHIIAEDEPVSSSSLSVVIDMREYELEAIQLMR